MERGHSPSENVVHVKCFCALVRGKKNVYGGKDLPKILVLILEWENSKVVMVKMVKMMNCHL